MFIQKVDSVYDIEWVDGITYGDVHHQSEVEHSTYNFEIANIDMLFKVYDMFEQEAKDILQAGLVLPAYDYILKCSHTFNLLDARNAISVAERQNYIARVRQLARLAAEAYVAQREKLGYPLIKEPEMRKALGLGENGGADNE